MLKCASAGCANEGVIAGEFNNSYNLSTGSNAVTYCVRCAFIVSRLSEMFTPNDMPKAEALLDEFEAEITRKNA